MPSHYLNQCWVIVDWTLRNILQWYFSQKLIFFIQENAFENVGLIWRSFCPEEDELIIMQWLIMWLWVTSHHKCKIWTHDDIIKWKHFPRYWPFVRGIHWSPVNSLHKGQWCRALMFSLICAWLNGWVNNHEAGDLRCHWAHYDITVMICKKVMKLFISLPMSLPDRNNEWLLIIPSYRKYWFLRNDAIQSGKIASNA